MSRWLLGWGGERSLKGNAMGRKRKIPLTDLSKQLPVDENGIRLSKTFRDGRKLYKIGDVNKLIGLTPRTIRYYDQMGLLTHVKRSQGQVRLFDDKDIELLKRARKLQKEGLTLEEVKEVLHGKKGAMPKVALVTDSTAAIPWEGMNKFPVEIVSLKLSIDDETFLDTEITPLKFWEKTKNMKNKPVTMTPSEEDFIAAYTKLSQKGYKKAFSLHISSTLSETYHIAVRAANKVADFIEVIVIDTRTTGAGLGLLVQLLAEAIQSGDSVEDLKRLAEQHISLAYKIVTVNSLQHLLAGGIIQGLSINHKNLLNKIFEFKPVISIRNGTGEVEILECAKNKKQALDFMVAQLEAEIKVRARYVKQILIIYNYMYGEAVELINRVKLLYPTTPVYLQEGSSVLSVYVGPESIGISII